MTAVSILRGNLTVIVSTSLSKYDIFSYIKLIFLFKKVISHVTIFLSPCRMSLRHMSPCRFKENKNDHVRKSLGSTPILGNSLKCLNVQAVSTGIIPRNLMLDSLGNQELII